MLPPHPVNGVIVSFSQTNPGKRTVSSSRLTTAENARNILIDTGTGITAPSRMSIDGSRLARQYGWRNVMNHSNSSSTVTLELPLLMLIVATRAALGVGVGLLLAEKLKEHRRAVGGALVA